MTYLTSISDTLLIGSTTLPSTATNTALAIAGGRSLIVPSDPIKVGGIDISDSPEAIVVDGGYAYVISGTTGDEIDIYDVSNPANPNRISGVPLGSGGQDVVKSGNYLYAVSNSGNEDMEIIDVSNPNNPIAVGSYEASGGLNDIVVSGRYGLLS